MAPEQLEGKDADARTDIFAFGAVLYEMATGKKAFSGTSQASLISAIMKEEPAPISAAEPASPAALDRVVRTCLAKDPEERWQSAADIRRELGWVGGDSAQAGAAAAPRSAPARRAWLPWTIAAAAVLAGVYFAAFRRAPAPAAAQRMELSIVLPERTVQNDFFALVAGRKNARFRRNHLEQVPPADPRAQFERCALPAGNRIGGIHLLVPGRAVARLRLARKAAPHRRRDGIHRGARGCRGGARREPGRPRATFSSRRRPPARSSGSRRRAERWRPRRLSRKAT